MFFILETFKPPNKGLGEIIARHIVLQQYTQSTTVVGPYYYRLFDGARPHPHVSVNNTVFWFVWDGRVPTD